MDERRHVEVTEEMLKCLEVLLMARDHLPEGDFKESYNMAVSYIDAALKGEELPRITCPGGGLILR